MKKLTKSQKRLLVLKDALKQVKTGFLVPSTGSVCNFMNLDGDSKNDAQILLKKMKKEKKKCTVCARGSLLLAQVGRFDKFTEEQLHTASFDGEYSSGSSTDSKLLELFSEEQIAMMETAFEKALNMHLLGSDLYQKCVYFGMKKDNAYDRLIEILTNAIKNKGIFKP